MMPVLGKVPAHIWQLSHTGVERGAGIADIDLDRVITPVNTDFDLLGRIILVRMLYQVCAGFIYSKNNVVLFKIGETDFREMLSYELSDSREILSYGSYVQGGVIVCERIHVAAG